VSKVAGACLSSLAAGGSAFLAFAAYEMPGTGVLAQAFGLCIGLTVCLALAFFNGAFRVSAFVLGEAVMLAGLYAMLFEPEQLNILGPAALVTTGLLAILAQGLGRDATGNRIGIATIMICAFFAACAARMLGQSMVVALCSLALGLCGWFLSHVLPALRVRTPRRR
jgi:hypothetical protein